jgi:hypothetical protein
MIPARAVRAYFGVQAVAILGWWIAVAMRAPVRSAFRAADAPDVTLLAFAPGDVLLAFGSAAVALGVPATHSWRTALAWLVAGGVAYGAVYTGTLFASGAAGPWGAVLMIPAALASLACARELDHAEPGPLPSGRAR